MHHSGGTGYGTGPQERVHQAPRTGTQPDKCPFETYQAQIPDCCAAAAALQDPYPRPPSGYDGRCYDECHRRTPYHEDTYSQVRDSILICLDCFFYSFRVSSVERDWNALIRGFINANEMSLPKLQGFVIRFGVLKLQAAHCKMTKLWTKIDIHIRNAKIGLFIREK